MLQGLGMLPLTAAFPGGVAGGKQVPISIADAARAAGRKFGTAARSDLIDQDPALRAAILGDCNSVTPEYHMKWDSVEGRAGSFWFDPVDALAAFAEQNELELRGHTLLWEQSTPAWARRKIRRGDWQPIRNWFQRVIARYPQVRDWEVVNEPIDTEKGRDGFRVNSFYRGFGADYVRRAMREARALAPSARLMINDYSLEYDNPVDAARRRMYLRLTESLKREGLIDAVGIQGHLDLAKGPIDPALVRTFLSDLAGLGVEIVITELDVKEADLSGPAERRDQRIASEAQRFLEGALQVPAVTGVTTWGLSDRHSWLHDQSRGMPPMEWAERINRGLPYDAALRQKPMYWSLRDAFLARA